MCFYFEKYTYYIERRESKGEVVRDTTFSGEGETIVL
jgi:hypothetical protein